MNEQEMLKNFGFNFKIARMKLGLTQDAIADKTDLSTTYICNCENGKHSLSLVNALKFAKIVNKTIEELIKPID